MKKGFFGVGLVAIILLLVLISIYSQIPQNGNVTQQEQTVPTITESPSTNQPTHEQAELVGFGFLQDFIAQAPPVADLEARQRAYDALSMSAKEIVSEETLSRDLALFVRVQDIPDQGASVEDLQIEGEGAILIVGLNYSGSGRVLRAINMVIENGMWKVDSIDPLDEYPPTQ